MSTRHTSLESRWGSTLAGPKSGWHLFLPNAYLRLGRKLLKPVYEKVEDRSQPALKDKHGGIRRRKDGTIVYPSMQTSNVLRYETLTDTAHFILIMMIWKAGNTNKAIVSISYLAKLLDKNKATVMHGIQELEDAGLIIKRKTMSAFNEKQNLINSYDILPFKQKLAKLNREENFRQTGVAGLVQTSIEEPRRYAEDDDVNIDQPAWIDEGESF